MDFNEYQDKAIETKMYPNGVLGILYTALGVASEAGEVAGKTKKVIRDNKGEFTDEKKEEIMKEISDTIWYCAALSFELGYRLNDVAEYNIKKLASRLERGVIQGSGDER